MKLIMYGHNFYLGVSNMEPKSLQLLRLNIGRVRVKDCQIDKNRNFLIWTDKNCNFLIWIQTQLFIYLVCLVVGSYGWQVEQVDFHGLDWNFISTSKISLIHEFLFFKWLNISYTGQQKIKELNEQQIRWYVITLFKIWFIKETV
jgi:hypothetical protein